MILVKRIRFGLAPPTPSFSRSASLSLSLPLLWHCGVPGKLTGPSACLGLLDWPQSIKRFNGACRCWISAYLMQMKRPSLSHSVVPPPSYSPPPSHSHSPLVSSAVRQTISQSRQTCVYKAFVFAHTPSKAGTPSSPLSNSAPCWCLLCAAPSPSASPSLSPCRPVSVSLSMSISVWRNLVQSMQTST